MNYKELAKATEYYKKDKEGVRDMCKAMEDFVLSDRAETALRMLKDEQLSKDKIAEYLDLPLEIIEELAENLEKE